MISLYSPKGTYDALFLGNYATINVNDALYRVPGVGQIQNFGTADYAMRIWVKPDTPGEPRAHGPRPLERGQAAEHGQSRRAASAREPAPKGQEFTYTVRSQGRLVTAEEFGNVVVRLNPDGSVVRLKDVSRIELGALNYQQRARAERQALLPDRRLPGPGLQRHRGRRRRQEDDDGAQGALPGRPRLRGLPRHHAAGHRGHQGDRAHALRGDRPRHHRGVPVPAGLARDAHSAARRAGVPGRHVHVLPARSASRSTRSRSSASCSRSASSWTTRSSWSRRSSTTSSTASRPGTRR